MKNLYLWMAIAAIGVAFYEQNSESKNTVVMVVAMGVFMFGLMKLSARIPSKKENDDHEQL